MSKESDEEVNEVKIDINDLCTVIINDYNKHILAKLTNKDIIPNYIIYDNVFITPPCYTLHEKWNYIGLKRIHYKRDDEMKDFHDIVYPKITQMHELGIFHGRITPSYLYFDEPTDSILIKFYTGMKLISDIEKDLEKYLEKYNQWWNLKDNDKCKSIQDLLDHESQLWYT